MRRYFGKHNELLYFLPPPSRCAQTLHTDVKTLIEDLMSPESRYFDSCCKIAKKPPFLIAKYLYTEEQRLELWKDFLNRPDAHEFYPDNFPNSNYHNYTYQDNVAALRALGLTPYQVCAMFMLEWSNLYYKLRYPSNHTGLNTLLEQGKKLL